MRITTVRAVNRLTTRWARAAVDGERGTVLTAAGLWPLLALLADGAAGPAREELAEALGLPADRAAGAAGELLAGLGRVPGLAAATGVWTSAALPLDPSWTARLPRGTRGTLTGDVEADRTALDGWAADRTGGLVDRVPVPLDAAPPMVLATALALRLRWIRPFVAAGDELHEGPWAGREVVKLLRSTSLLHRVRVAEAPCGPVTLLEVVGDGGVDVHLALGAPGAGPGEVLDGAVAAVTRAVGSVDGFALPEGSPGPGLTVGTRFSYRPEPRLDIETVAFSVDADHDLMRRRGLFGLETASDTGSGHFPGISDSPLAVGSAGQAAVARFHAEGFEAAAVTAMGMAVGAAASPPPYRIRRIEVSFDRPFGFLAVHRTSRLVLAAGWVTDPVPYEGTDDDLWDEDDFDDH
ncbi:serpin family protein [Streptomyces sp. NPDC093225]|uniref:serpin family protein n=1 Tax=Streptomyces sp. NPDC093225 TaxID=3366034 RepID=UPI00381121EA